MTSCGSNALLVALLLASLISLGFADADLSMVYITIDGNVGDTDITNAQTGSVMLQRSFVSTIFVPAHSEERSSRVNESPRVSSPVAASSLNAFHAVASSAIAPGSTPYGMLAIKLSVANESHISAPPDSDIHFRPVSTSLWCVIFLTFQGLLPYTGLSIARNMEELSGSSKESRTTDILKTLTQTAMQSPMLAVCFLGYSVYVLAPTGGKGEPHLWVNASMLGSTLGLCGQCVVMLALASMSGLNKGKDDYRVVDAETTHPVLHNYSFRSELARVLAHATLYVLLLAFYGGLVGVLYGMYSHSVGKIPVAHFGKCGCVLSALFFFTQCISWCVREYCGFRATMDAVGGAVRVTRSFPLYCVLFLAASMHAWQFNPTLGAIPAWAIVCVYVATVSLCLETCAAAIVGATAVVSTKHYSQWRLNVSTAASFARYLSAAISYSCIVPIFFSVYIIRNVNGTPAEWSLSMSCTISLVTLCLFLNFLWWVACSIQDFGWASSASMEAVLRNLAAARVSVEAAPMICVLFLACRMRALLITQAQGGPQPWAEHAMCACVLAIFTQACWYILLPMITNFAVQFHADGHVLYEFSPVVAYAASMGKYVALFLLNGGVLGVCVAVFTMTPEKCMVTDHEYDAYSHLLIIFLFSLVIAFSTFFSFGEVIGLAIKLGIESIDRVVLGADVSIRRVALSPCQGLFRVIGLKVMQPEHPVPGRNWNCAHAVEAKEVVININIWRLIKSGGRNFEVTRLSLDGIQINVEKYSLCGTSNINLLLRHITSTVDTLADKVSTSRNNSAPDHDHAVKAVRGSGDAVGLAMRKVSVTGIGADFFIGPASVDLRLCLAPIDYADFTKDVGQLPLADVVHLLLGTILRTVAANATILKAVAADGAILKTVAANAFSLGNSPTLNSKTLSSRVGNAAHQICLDRNCDSPVSARSGASGHR